MTGGLFSKREITSQLEIALQEQREVDFEDHERERLSDSSSHSHGCESDCLDSLVTPNPSKWAILDGLACAILLQRSTDSIFSLQNLNFTQEA